MSKMRMKTDPTMLKGGVATLWGPAELWTMGVSLLKYILTCLVTETASDCKGLSRRKLWKLTYCCDRSGVISSQDQLVPLFLEQMLGGMPGLSGLLVAGVFSASLSSISANLHSLATVSMQDFIRVWIVYISSQREIYKGLTIKPSSWIKQVFILLAQRKYFLVAHFL